MKAIDVMTRDLMLLTENSGLAMAYGAMRNLGIRHLPVVDGHKVIGLVSDRDLLKHSASDARGNLSFARRHVSEIMTTKLLTCDVEASLADVANLMLANKIDSVPVVDDAGDLLGLVTSHDLLKVVRGASLARLRRAKAL